MADIQSPTAEIRRGNKKRRRKKELECGPMPNLMVALPNIGGALCSTPQSLLLARHAKDIIFICPSALHAYVKRIFQ